MRAANAQQRSRTAQVARGTLVRRGPRPLARSASRSQPERHKALCVSDRRPRNRSHARQPRPRPLPSWA